MRRRELLAGAAAATVLGGGAWFVAGGTDPTADADAVEPVELESLDAPGSEAGTLPVPEPGRVTFVEFFATWCTVCSDVMPNVGEVYDELGDEVQFISVTNEPLGRTTTKEDVADWWEEHDGRWTVAHDADLELSQALEVNGVPYAFVFDERNVQRWSGRGYKSVEEIREPIETTLSETE